MRRPKRYYQPVIPTGYYTGPMTPEILGRAAAFMLGLARDCSRPISGRVAGSFHALAMQASVTAASVPQDPRSL